MRGPGHAPPYAVTHSAWTSLRAEQLSDRVTVRHLRGAASEACWITIEAGGKLALPGLPAECLLTVIEGRARSFVLGNEVELLKGHFAMLPPQLPFVLRAAGRSPTTLLLTCGASLGDSVALEAE